MRCECGYLIYFVGRHSIWDIIAYRSTCFWLIVITDQINIQSNDKMGCTKIALLELTLIFLNLNKV